MQNTTTKRKNLATSNMVKIALLSAISFVLTLPMFRWQLPIFPGFLQLDMSDVPAIVGLVAMGPIPAIWIAALKNILDVAITGTSSAGIGPFANFILSASYVLSMGYVIHRLKGTKGMIIGLVVATLFTTVVSAIFNYTILIRAYAFVFGAEIDTFVAMATAINPRITNFESFIALSIAPFNILKFGLASIVFMLLYLAIGDYIKPSPKKQSTQIEIKTEKGELK